MTISSFTSQELSGIGIGPSHGVAMTRLNSVITQTNLNALQLADVTLAVADASGGATGAALTADLKDLNGVALAKEGVFEIVASNTEYAGVRDLNTNVTFGTATKGSILASGSGWAVVKANSSGEFACTASNSTDEAVQFSAVSCNGGVDALANGVLIRGCIPDSATWSA